MLKCVHIAPSFAPKLSISCLRFVRYVHVASGFPINFSGASPGQHCIPLPSTHHFSETACGVKVALSTKYITPAMNNLILSLLAMAVLAAAVPIDLPAAASDNAQGQSADDGRPALSFDDLPASLRAQIARGTPRAAKALEVLAELDLHDPDRMRIDQDGAVFVVDDAAAAPEESVDAARRKRRSVNIMRQRRMFSGTAATGFTATGKSYSASPH